MNNKEANIILDMYDSKKLDAFNIKIIKLVEAQNEYDDEIEKLTKEYYEAEEYLNNKED